MRCSFCKARVSQAVVSSGAYICQNCVANAVQQFSRAFHDRTDIKRAEPMQGEGRFHADAPSPLMAA